MGSIACCGSTFPKKVKVSNTSGRYHEIVFEDDESVGLIESGRRLWNLSQESLLARDELKRFRQRAYSEKLVRLRWRVVHLRALDEY